MIIRFDVILSCNLPRLINCPVTSAKKASATSKQVRLTTDEIARHQAVDTATTTKHLTLAPNSDNH
jgi:hypothetical protein